MQNPFFTKVRFVKSVTNINDRPKPVLPEIAFAGRSNVGKSSLLNAVFNTRKLAKVSSTPGKTRLINYFIVEELFYFVDLPGYGFAKIPKKISRKWQEMLENYLLKSENLKLIFLLIDSRHELMASDENMADWLNYHNIPYIIILTKTDKLSKNKIVNQVNYYQQKFPDHHIVPFSIRSSKQIQNFQKHLLKLL